MRKSRPQLARVNRIFGDDAPAALGEKAIDLVALAAEHHETFTIAS